MSFKKNKNKKGFSLLELLVSIAIFGMMSIFLSNMVISLAKFSADNDTRNDILSEMDNAAIKIKNDMRASVALGGVNESKVNVCFSSIPGGGGRWLLTKTIGTDSYVLDGEKGGGVNRLAWFKTSGCTGKNNAGNNDQVLTSGELLSIHKVRVNFTDDGGGPSSANNLIYVVIDLCDSNQRIFQCNDSDAYRYFFAISQRS